MVHAYGPDWKGPPNDMRPKFLALGLFFVFLPTKITEILIPNRRMHISSSNFTKIHFWLGSALGHPLASLSLFALIAFGV